MYSLHIQNGTVTRDTDDKTVAPCQDADDIDFIAYINWVEAGNAPKIIDEPTLIITPHLIPAYEFRDRFTETEMGAVLDAAYSGNAICRQLLLKLQTANDGIDTHSNAVISGVRYLVHLGLLSAQRAGEVLV